MAMKIRLFLGTFLALAWIGMVFEGEGFAKCNDTIPEELRLPKVRSGVDYTIYETVMDDAFVNDRKLFEELFAEHVQKFNNISGSVIHFPKGEKHVYRSAMLAYSPDTIKELMKERGVSSIFHLSNTDIVDQVAWTEKEKSLFREFGGVDENYHHIMGFSYKNAFEDSEELLKVRKKVADIIHLIEGKPGNVLIHCLGGEHKTGLIFEIMQKCYNFVPMDNIIERYKCHTAYDVVNPTGYKQANVDFIASYPCEMLKY